jgi:hypothetical protein
MHRRLSAITGAVSAVFLSIGIAAAQVVVDCDTESWIASPANIFEPWEEHTRTFANGNIRIAHLDTGGEPVCCASHIMVLSPFGQGADWPVYLQCRLISDGAGAGFFWAEIAAAQASYDPARGLLVSIPVQRWHQGVESGEPARPGTLRVRINQATGGVTLE